MQRSATSTSYSWLSTAVSTAMEGNDAFRSAAAAAAAADSPSAPAPARVPVVASQALHSKRHMLYRDYAARRTAAAAATTTTGARGRLSAAYRAVGEGVGAFLLLSLCLAMSVYLVVGRTSYTATDAGDGSDVSYVLLIDAGKLHAVLHAPHSFVQAAADRDYTSTSALRPR